MMKDTFDKETLMLVKGSLDVLWKYSVFNWKFSKFMQKKSHVAVHQHCTKINRFLFLKFNSLFWVLNKFLIGTPCIISRPNVSLLVKIILTDSMSSHLRAPCEWKKRKPLRKSQFLHNLLNHSMYTWTPT